MAKIKNKVMTDATAIYNYVPINDRIASSGQPQREQFQAIKGAGFDVVINLALASSEGAVIDEDAAVTELGMTYLHIPVDFANPTVADIQAFFALMRGLRARKVWVHCQVNARVSAFLYHYLRYELGFTDEDASGPVLSAWLPQMDETWREFLALTKEQIG